MHKLSQLGFLTPPFPQCKLCLLYADDTLLILKPTSTQINRAKLIFHLFGHITGLKISLTKSELAITSSNPSLTQDLANVMQCKSCTFPMKYLGLPLSDRRLARADYLPILDKIQAALAGWKASLLSIGGRLILTNAVLSSIPQFFMSAFLLPKWVLRKIDQMRRKFLWHGHKHSQSQAKGVYMVNWVLATRPKELGGLGVRDIRMANWALFMKWMWQWVQNDHAWWKEATPMANLSDRPWDAPQATPFWKSMQIVAPAFNASTSYQIGNGETVKFWHDNWLTSPIKYQFPKLYQFVQDKQNSVAQTAQADGWIFRHSLLPYAALTEKNSLLTMLQSMQPDQNLDSATWLRSTSNFSVSSTYKFLTQVPAPFSPIANVWSIKAPLRIMIFGWLLCNNKLLTVDNLIKKGWCLPNMCVLCRADEENAAHLFQSCSLAQQIRRYIQEAFGSQLCISQRFKTLASTSMLTDKKENIQIRRLELATSFVLWRERCRRLFNDKEMQMIPLVREIKEEYGSWTS